MVLRAADDPTDHLRIVGALRTPLLGCGDDDLFRHKVLDGRRVVVQHARRRPIRPTASSSAGLAFLREIHQARHWQSPAELLDRIARDRRALELGFAEGRPRDVWRRLRFVIDQARAWSEATGGSLRAYLHWVDQQTAEGSRVAESVLPETDDDAVRIMTIHAAKGLEFPITIVSRPVGAARRRCAARWRCTSPRTAGRSATAWARQVVTEEFEAAVPIDEQMGYDERVRLLYVACTRAMRPPRGVAAPRRAQEPARKLSSRTNAEVLLARHGRRSLDGLPDLSGEPMPRRRRPRRASRRRRPLRRVGRPSAAPPSPSPAVPAPSPPPRSPTRATPDLGRRARAGRRRRRPASPSQAASARRAAPPVQPSLLDDGEPGRRSTRPLEPDGRPRPAEAAPRPRPAAVAEGPLRHRGRPGRARRAPDDRPRHRRRARRRRRRPVPGRGGARPRRRRPPPRAGRPRRRRRCGPPPAAAALARGLRLHARSATGCSRATSTSSTAATTGWWSSTTRPPPPPTPSSSTGASTGYRLQGAAYAVAVGRATGEPVARVVFLFLTPQGAVERELTDLAAAMADVERLVQRRRGARHALTTHQRRRSRR